MFGCTNKIASPFPYHAIPEFLDSGRKSWTLDAGRWTLDTERYTVDVKLKTVQSFGNDGDISITLFLNSALIKILVISRRKFLYGLLISGYSF